MDKANITFVKIIEGAYRVLLDGAEIGSVWKGSNCWTASPAEFDPEHVVVPWIRRRDAVDQLLRYAQF